MTFTLIGKTQNEREGLSCVLMGSSYLASAVSNINIAMKKLKYQHKVIFRRREREF